MTQLRSEEGFHVIVTVWGLAGGNFLFFCVVVQVSWTKL